jgi:nucleoside-diphosphate-sugar epimerase
MKVFVTGGTGLVGSHVIAALRARGDVVRALARSEASAAALSRFGAEPVRGDLSDAARLEAAIAGCDAVVHAAAAVLQGGGWAEWREVNVLGTERVARGAARARARLIHLSSVAVYGRSRAAIDRPGHTEDFDLQRAPAVREPYARSKREAEIAVWNVAAETGLSAVALRPCVLYGEGDRHFSPRIARVVRRAIVPLIGDGANRIAVVYAGNVAAAVIAALDRPETTGPFNITNDGRLTLREFVERFATGLGVAPRWVRIPRGLAWPMARAWDATIGTLGSGGTPSLSSAVQFLAGENRFASARAERVLGWRPAVAAAEAAERTGASFRAPSRRRRPP